jgi:hypothetical protein
MTSKTKERVEAPAVEETALHRIMVEMKHDSAVLVFTRKDQAQMEYNRIKAAGIYCGAWITRLDFNGAK